MSNPAPTYRIVNSETGKELKPYQTVAHAAVFIAGKRLIETGRNVDSKAFNLHTIYVREPA